MPLVPMQLEAIQALHWFYAVAGLFVGWGVCAAFHWLLARIDDRLWAASQQERGA